MSDLQNLSDNLDAGWVQRLWQRGEQPGVVRLAQMQATAVRLSHQGHLPLADEVIRRYAAVMALQEELPPIVYAQPALPAHVPNTSSATGAAIPPLPVVSAQPAVAAVSPLVIKPVVANPLVANPLIIKPVVANPGVAPAVKVDSPPTASQRPLSAQTHGRTPPQPAPAEAASAEAAPGSTGQPSPAKAAPGSTAVSPLPLPVVRPQLPVFHLTNRSTNRAATQPVNRVQQDEKVVRSTAVSPSLPSVQEDAPILAVAPAMPTAPATLPLPVVQTTLPPLLPTPTAQPFAPLVVKPHPPESSQPGNGRATSHTGLPIAREPFGAASVPVPATMSQSLPLAQPPAPPMAGVIQRVAQETAVNRPSRPSPTPNRVVPTGGVVQRTAQADGTAVIQRQDETDAPPATAESLDMDELVDKVHRRFLRRLAVESERRGKTAWP